MNIICWALITLPGIIFFHKSANINKCSALSRKKKHVLIHSIFYFVYFQVSRWNLILKCNHRNTLNLNVRKSIYSNSFVIRSNYYRLILIGFRKSCVSSFCWESKGLVHDSSTNFYDYPWNKTLKYTAKSTICCIFIESYSHRERDHHKTINSKCNFASKMYNQSGHKHIIMHKLHILNISVLWIPRTPRTHHIMIDSYHTKKKKEGMFYKENEISQWYIRIKHKK